MRKLLNILGVMVGAVILTTLGVSATDTLQGTGGSLLGLVLQQEQREGCASDSVEMTVDGRVLCVDLFEASAGDGCATTEPRTIMDSDRNLSAASCIPVSVAGKTPWRFINLSQAQRACAAAGKRLLTNAEWYRAALGTSEAAECIVRSSGPRAATESTCRSAVGAYDMIGNAWEWVDGMVRDGTYDGRQLPKSGYVTGVDGDGVALSTQNETADTLYGKDYFWSGAEGVRGLIRGGFYGSEEDGGVFALNASVDVGFGSAGVGFRCVRDYPQK